MEERDFQQQLEQYAVDFHSGDAATAAAGGGNPAQLQAALVMALGGGQQADPHGGGGGPGSPPMKRYRPKPELGHRASSSVDDQYGGEPDDDNDHNQHIQVQELMTSDHHQKYLEAAASAVDHHVMMLQQQHQAAARAAAARGSLIPTALPLMQQQSQNQQQELSWARISIDETLQNRASASLISLLSGGMGGAGPGGAGGSSSGGEMDTEQRELLQSHIVSHPLFQQLLDAHVACLKMGTPAERWPEPAAVEAQLAVKQQELQNRLLMLARNAPPPRDKDHLDSFMLSFTLLLQTFRDQLREHIHVHSAEAMAACSEIKEAFLRLTGKEKLEENANTGGGSDDETIDDEDYFDLVLSSDQQQDQSSGHAAGYNASNDLMMGGAISDVDRTLMENVRKELKLELKQSYRSKLADVREEIMRKRRAGKLPGITTSVLKEWWDAHSKWPYPTEEEKVRLAQETGLDLKQINNWFINQRKRNWNTNRPLEWPQVDLGATFSLGPSTS